MDNALEVLDMIDEENAEEFLQFLANIDAIEAAEYREIVKNRLRILEKLQQGVQNRALERVLEEYLFKNLWLLDPAWERADRVREHGKSGYKARCSTSKEEHALYERTSDTAASPARTSFWS